MTPKDEEIEKMVLGAVLIEEDAINQVIPIINSDNIFWNRRNRIIWTAIRHLFNQNKSIDSATVAEYIMSSKKEQSNEIALYIIQLTNNVGSSAHIEDWCYILKEKYIRRRLIELGALLQQNAKDTFNDIFDVNDKHITELDALNGEINRGEQKSFSEIVTERAAQIKEAATNQSYTTGIKTYLNELDRVTLGWQPTDLIIIAARPAMGKTALALDIARKQAKNEQAAVGIFSLEMSAAQLVDRVLSAETNIHLETIRKGGLKYTEWQVFDDAIQPIKQFPIYICDKGGMTINEICSIAKNWKIKYGLKVMYVDYIQLITGNEKKGGNREQEISSISRRLKQLAKELHIPVIALSQLSRACEARADKRPMLSDLRESGAIEQDADVVIFPYRDDYYNESAETGLTELIIGKHRNGKVGKVEARFIPEIQKFTDL